MVVDAEHVLPQPDIVLSDVGVGPAHILTIIIHREPHPVPTSSEDHVNIVRAGEAFNTNRASTDPVAPPSTSRNGDRKSVVEGKSVSVRVDIGGRRIIKKKKQNQ